MRRTLPVGFSILLLLTFCFPQDGPRTGSTRGEVVTRNQNGEPAVLPDARIVLRGSTNKEARSDGSGAFAIDGLPPAMYDLEASAPGLNSTLAVEVKPGTTSMVTIELDIAAGIYQR